MTMTLLRIREHNVLRYQWAATAGNIVNANAATTSWTLPNSPRLHFAYALVSDGKSGYHEASVAISNDGGLTLASLPTLAAPAPSGRVPPTDHFLTCFSSVDRAVYSARGADSRRVQATTPLDRRCAGLHRHGLSDQPTGRLRPLEIEVGFKHRDPRRDGNLRQRRRLNLQRESAPRAL